MDEALFIMGKDCWIVLLIHARKIKSVWFVGNGMSGMLGGVVLLFEGMLDGSWAVLLYPSNVRASDDAR